MSEPAKESQTHLFYWLLDHNGWRFDVPFLINEFKRCSEDIPSDWLFLDTMKLARHELAKLLKLKGSMLPSKGLENLIRKYYEIPLVGEAHRAMSDEYLLSKVLQAMTMELSIPLIACWADLSRPPI